MKLSSILCTSLVALALSSTAAFAEQVRSIHVFLEAGDDSIVIADGVTDSKGNVSFGKLAPGNYVLVIEGKTLVAAIDRLGSSREGAGREGASRGDGNTGDADGGHGGVIASTGDLNPDERNSVLRPLQMDGGDGDNTAAVRPGNLVVNVIRGTPGADDVLLIVSSEQPYHREEARKGMRFKFKIAENESPRPQDRVTTVTMTISYTGLE